MSTVVATTLAALVLFAAFHVPVPLRRDGAWRAVTLTGPPAMACGIGYHLLLLPAVAALPAPPWAVAAGYAWMFADIILDAAAVAGSQLDHGPLRDGTHVVSAVWLLAAGWTNGPLTGLAGTALSLAFGVRLVAAAAGRRPDRWFFHLNAALNVVWMATVALALRGA
ncbi:hypothetical protein [Nocardioides sp. GY 10127]|uniref:hypothetical protein n=1 Tax=Nocardioides sp. GY 10127 TaxID=2569762 RepID=UPI0010A75DEF|nr:hypothetical protein [Nocardioides sp. GY 10127]TIC82756.1 hypothetical protein E8D37_08695 [Nocardioides sp. GY 10127]